MTLDNNLRCQTLHTAEVQTPRRTSQIYTDRHSMTLINVLQNTSILNVFSTLILQPALVQSPESATVTAESMSIEESNIVNETIELQSMIDEIEARKNELSPGFNLKFKSLCKEVKRNRVFVRELLEENLKFKKEICELRNTPPTVSILPRNDERISPSIDKSVAVSGISSLQTELLIYNAVSKKDAENADLHIAVDWVSKATIKLLSATKEQVSRALYNLAKSLYIKKMKNMFVGSFNHVTLEKLLQPSEYALVLGFETTVQKYPDMAPVLLKFCTKLEFELLHEGQLSHCRMYASVCKLLNEPYIAFRICKDLLLCKKSKGLIFVAMIGCIYPEALSIHYNPDELANIETKLFYNIILSRPEKMMQVEQCHYIFRKLCHLPAAPTLEIDDITESVLQNLVQDFLQDIHNNAMPSLLCVKLLKLLMGYSWLISNILDPFLQRVGNQKNLHLKKLSQILQIFSEIED